MIIGVNLGQDPWLPNITDIGYWYKSGSRPWWPDINPGQQSKQSNRVK